MVKRKADISLDEWLERGTAIPGASHTNVAAATESPVKANCPTAEAVPHTVTVEPVTTTCSGSTDQGEGAAEWFWALLELSGYERW